MEDKVYNIEYIKAILTPVFESYDVKKAIVFGSYGKGNADKISSYVSGKNYDEFSKNSLVVEACVFDLS